MAGDQSRPVVPAAQGGFELRQVQSGSRQRGVMTAETFGGDQPDGPRPAVRRPHLRPGLAHQRQARERQENDDGFVASQERNLPAILH